MVQYPYGVFMIQKAIGRREFLVGSAAALGLAVFPRAAKALEALAGRKREYQFLFELIGPELPKGKYFLSVRVRTPGDKMDQPDSDAFKNTLQLAHGFARIKLSNREAIIVTQNENGELQEVSRKERWTAMVNARELNYYGYSEVRPMEKLRF